MSYNLQFAKYASLATSLLICEPVSADVNDYSDNDLSLAQQDVDYITHLPSDAVPSEIQVLFETIRNSDAPSGFVHGYFRKTSMTNVTPLLPDLNISQLDPILNSNTHDEAQLAAIDLLKSDANFFNTLPYPDKLYAAIVVLEALQYDGYDRREQNLQRNVQNKWPILDVYADYEEQILDAALESLSANKIFLESSALIKNPADIGSLEEAEEQYYARLTYYTEISNAIFTAFRYAQTDILLAALPDDINYLRGLSWEVPQEMSWPDSLPREFLFINYAPGNRANYINSWDDEFEKSTRTIIEETMHRIHNYTADAVLEGRINADDPRFIHGIGYIINGASKAVISQEFCGQARRALDEGRTKEIDPIIPQTCFRSQNDYRNQYRERYAKSAAQLFGDRLKEILSLNNTAQTKIGETDPYLHHTQ